MKVMADVPYIVGLDKWLGGELDDAAKTYLKDFGAATASNGAVGLYHVENITPEAVKYGKDLIAENAKVYVVDDAELQRVYESYPRSGKEGCQTEAVFHGMSPYEFTAAHRLDGKSLSEPERSR